jgi:hypothetical protein
MAIGQLLLFSLGMRWRKTSRWSSKAGAFENKWNEDLLCFHLVVLLLERVDFAADHLNLLNMAGDWAQC